MRTLLIDDCIDNGMDYNNGGARYKWSIISFAGLVNVIDSLIVTRGFVFEKKLYTKEVFLEKLKANDEEFLKQARSYEIAYGNDDARADELASRLSKDVFATLDDKKPAIGDGFIPASILFNNSASGGSYVGATPDGRRANSPIADSVAAIFQKDVNGPLALLNSVTNLDLAHAIGIPVLNFNVQPDFDVYVLKNLISGYIEKGGDDQFQHTPLYKGEALALRAMLHFDLMRLFGPPAWADAQAKASVMPYVTKYAFDITPFSSYDDVYKYIIDDLKTAEECLKADETLLPAVRDNAAAGFTSCRIIHMNLYAVQALLARVYWYKGDLVNAAAYASKVIESGKFSFRPREEFIQSENGTLNLHETIFGIYSQQSNMKNAKAFGFSSSSTTLTVRDDAYVMFNDGSSTSGSDLRLSAWFDGTQFKNLVNRAYVEGSNSYDGKSILGINMIRIAEMYYIMAEALMESDPAAATEYYDAVVVTRDLDALTGVATVTADILYNERCKEFFGEGYRWFDMKRLGKDIQVSTSVLLPGNSLNTYVIPMPLSEEENRQ